MRDYEQELKNRIEWIRDILKKAGAKGIIYGNSGGKDSVLVGILSKMAAENVVGVIMPCGSKQNFGKDKEDALIIAEQFGIKTMTVDLTEIKAGLCAEISKEAAIKDAAEININPRLRMTTLYAMGQSMGYLVAGTGNASEVYMGYFTKWGDGAYDFNPVYDLTVTEIYEFLRYLKVPDEIIEKAPSAGLYEGQTDEKDMGVSYAAIDMYIKTGKAASEDAEKIEKAHRATAHKRVPPYTYS